MASQSYNLNHRYNTRSSANGNDKLLQYDISIKELGRGAFSKVFVATHKPTKTKVAMKIVQINKYVTLSMNEVQLLRRINSEYVIKLHDAFVAHNILHVALELIDGEDLSVRIQRMRDRGTIFSERTIWYKFHQMCAGIKDLDDKRILHRDLKPANIFITLKYRVKIGDLGLSRLCSSATNNVKTHVGTEYYMAPERNDGGGYHFQSDIWSLGCLLYEICTFRSFNGETTNAFALHKKINNGDIIPFPMHVYSEQLMYFTFACLNVRSDERSTAQECADASCAMCEKFERMLADYNSCIDVKTPYNYEIGSHVVQVTSNTDEIKEMDIYASIRTLNPIDIFDQESGERLKPDSSTAFEGEDVMFTTIQVPTFAPERQKIVIGAPHDISIDGPHDVKKIVMLKICNNKSHRIGWKIESNNKDRLFLKPAYGALEPRTSVLVSMHCNAFQVDQEDTNNDCIIIKWTKTPDGAGKRFNGDWFKRTDAVKGEKSLRVKYNP